MNADDFAGLQRENAQLKRELRRLKLAIKAARHACARVYGHWLTVQAAGERKGVPRGHPQDYQFAWSLFRGSGEVARTVLALLPDE